MIILFLVAMAVTHFVIINWSIAWGYWFSGKLNWLWTNKYRPCSRQQMFFLTITWQKEVLDGENPS